MHYRKSIYLVAFGICIIVVSLMLFPSKWSSVKRALGPFAINNKPSLPLVKEADNIPLKRDWQYTVQIITPSKRLPLAKLHVLITNIDNNNSYRFISDESGRFILPAGGMYRLEPESEKWVFDSVQFEVKGPMTVVKVMAFCRVKVSLSGYRSTAGRIYMVSAPKFDQFLTKQNKRLKPNSKGCLFKGMDIETYRAEQFYPDKKVVLFDKCSEFSPFYILVQHKDLERIDRRHPAWAGRMENVEKTPLETVEAVGFPQTYACFPCPVSAVIPSEPGIVYRFKVTFSKSTTMSLHLGFFYGFDSLSLHLRRFLEGPSGSGVNGWPIVFSRHGKPRSKVIYLNDLAPGRYRLSGFGYRQKGNQKQCEVACSVLNFKVRSFGDGNLFLENGVGDHSLTIFIRNPPQQKFFSMIDGGSDSGGDRYLGSGKLPLVEELLIRGLPCSTGWIHFDPYKWDCFFRFDLRTRLRYQLIYGK